MVFVDEPTTGVDVGTRRFIWDRVREAARERCAVLTTHDMDLTLTLTLTLTLALTRCVVLTTHYMDEADALAQRIGIMAAGRLSCLGTSLFLKVST